jgi:hypothetical protein
MIRLPYIQGDTMAQFAGQQTNAPKSNFWTGSKAGFQDIPLYTQQQQGAQNQALQTGLGLLNNPGQSPMAQQAINQFNTQTIPGLAERFTALGGGQRSSGFQQALGAAGSGLQQSLASMGFQQALPLLQYGGQQQYQTAHIPGQQGFLQGIAGPLLQALLSGATGGIGGLALGGTAGIGKGIGAGLLGGMGGQGGGMGGGQGGGLAEILKLIMGGG